MPEQVLIMVNLRGTHRLKVEGTRSRDELEKQLQSDRDRMKDPEVIKKHKEREAKFLEETGEACIWGPIELDPRIKDIVNDLSDAGYVTTYSCQGRSKNHPEGMWETGVVGLAGEPSDMTKENREEIRAIVKEHTTVPFRIETNHVGAFPLRIQFSGPIS